MSRRNIEIQSIKFYSYSTLSILFKLSLTLNDKLRAAAAANTTCVVVVHKAIACASL